MHNGVKYSFENEIASTLKSLINKQTRINKQTGINEYAGFLFENLVMILESKAGRTNSVIYLIIYLLNSNKPAGKIFLRMVEENNLKNLRKHACLLGISEYIHLPLWLK